jgi:hypothetical protein
MANKKEKDTKNKDIKGKDAYGASSGSPTTERGHLL